MVTSICPICGSMMDGLPNLEPKSAWYKKYHPHLKVGSVVPSLCLDCSSQYSIGDFVIFRSERWNNPNILVITDIISSPDQLDIYQLVDYNVTPRYAAISEIAHKKVEYPEAKPRELSKTMKNIFD